MNKAYRAVKTFKAGYNCSQAVLSSYAEDYGLDRALAFRMANGFGAGMGRAQEMCGAVTGAILVLGLVYGRAEGESEEKHETAYRKTQEFLDRFRKENGSLNCRELLSGCSFQTEEGRLMFSKEKLIERCYAYAASACALLDRIIAETPDLLSLDSDL